MRRGIVTAIEQIASTTVHIEIYAICVVDSVLPDACAFESNLNRLVFAGCLYDGLCPEVVASSIFQPSSQLVFSQNSGVQADIHCQVVMQPIAIGIVPLIRTDSTEEWRLNNETYRDIKRLLIRGYPYRGGIISRFNRVWHAHCCSEIGIASGWQCADSIVVKTDPITCFVSV